MHPSQKLLQCYCLLSGSLSTLHITNGVGMVYPHSISLFISRNRIYTQSSQKRLNLRLLWSSQEILDPPTSIAMSVCFPVYEKIEKVKIGQEKSINWLVSWKFKYSHIHSFKFSQAIPIQHQLSREQNRQNLGTLHAVDGHRQKWDNYVGGDDYGKWEGF